MSAPYSARRASVDGFEVAELRDAARDMLVVIVPSIGNMAYRIERGGRNFLYFPYDGPAQLQANPKLCGVPFLGPWANRLDGDAYWANGKLYHLNPDLAKLRRDPNGLPIHGLLNFSPLWRLESLDAEADAARATSKLDFYRYPDLMAQFPFAHSITMTYRLCDGLVEVETILENWSTDPMPVAIGFHPYFQIASREECKVHLGARRHLVLNDRLLPTGESRPLELADPVMLKDVSLDDGFIDLDGSEFWVEGPGGRIAVEYGPKYRVAVVYAPRGHDYICFEPMSAVTNAFNLAHAGKYGELQTVPPGGRWQEIFRVRV